METINWRRIHDVADQAAAEIRNGFEEAVGDRIPSRAGQVRVRVPTLESLRVDEFGRGDDFGLLHGMIADAGGRKVAYDFLVDTTLAGIRFTLECDGTTYSGYAWAWDRYYHP